MLDWSAYSIKELTYRRWEIRDQMNGLFRQEFLRTEYNESSSMLLDYLARQKDEIEKHVFDRLVEGTLNNGG